MGIYIIISLMSIVLVIFSFSYQSKTVLMLNGKKWSTITVVSCLELLSLLIIMGIRADTVGIDTSVYARIYKAICEATSIQNLIGQVTFSGPIYISVCWLISRFSANYSVVIFLCAVIIHVGLYYFFKNNSQNMLLSIAIWIGIGLYYFSFNGNRQILAGVINLNAFDQIINERNIKKGIVLLFIGVGIHPTSIIMSLILMGAFISNKIQDKRKLFFFSAVAGIVTGLFFTRVINILLRILPQYAKYTTSMEGRATIFDNSGGGRIIIFYLFLLLVCSMWCFLSERNDENEDEEDEDEEELENDDEGSANKYFPTLIFVLGFSIVNSKNVYVSRMVLYYLSLFSVFFPGLIYKMEKGKKLLCFIVLLGLFTFSTYGLFENQNGIVPYATFFD